MLTPPLSLLSSDLIDEIVDWVAVLCYLEGIRTLLKVDREFGSRCRAHIFRELRVRVGRFATIPTLRRLLETNPHIVPLVRQMQVVFQNQVNLWPTTPDLDLGLLTHSLAKSPNPPSSLVIWVSYNTEVKIDNPEGLTQWLATSFFSSTLLKLDLSSITNFPIEAVRACIALRSLKVFSVKISTSRKPLTSGIEGCRTPELEAFDFEKSQHFVQRLTEDSHAGPQHASLKKLKVLKACLEDKVHMLLLQPILDQAQDALEELQLHAYKVTSRQAPSDFLNLQNTPQLRRFGLSATLAMWNRPLTIVADIVRMLSSVPTNSNTLETADFEFTAYEAPPYDGTQSQDWTSLATEIARISSGRSMKFEVRLKIVGNDDQRKDLGVLHRERYTSIT
ncbi:hypothetical protein BKA70DRAFT_1441104 [Coprinopsis sp. MPI-PUGE-AT-0042]|nr:hypothetical protein BKA70DRAFT_1441104 [Coprinopsis sp. MPI-PUGE-AT-0042]